MIMNGTEIIQCRFVYNQNSFIAIIVVMSHKVLSLFNVPIKKNIF